MFIVKNVFVPDDHILSYFKHSIADLGTIVHNSEAFGADRKECMLYKYYIAAQTIFDQIA